MMIGFMGNIVTHGWTYVNRRRSVSAPDRSMGRRGRAWARAGPADEAERGRSCRRRGARRHRRPAARCEQPCRLRSDAGASTGDRRGHDGVHRRALESVETMSDARCSVKTLLPSARPEEFAGHASRGGAHGRVARADHPRRPPHGRRAGDPRTRRRPAHRRSRHERCERPRCRERWRSPRADGRSACPRRRGPWTPPGAARRRSRRVPARPARAGRRCAAPPAVGFGGHEVDSV